MKLANHINDFILEATSANRVDRVTKVQSLWSGYGQICRVELSGAPYDTVILKHVAPPPPSSHSRGTPRDRSHARKLRSYEVEANWYANLSAQCDVGCRVPRCWATQQLEGQFLFVLEDLDANGFSLRRSRLDLPGVLLGLEWLARFHARFLGVAPVGLWDIGTYWHLATRPDELAAMPESKLKTAARAIDARLNQCAFQTIVHGDAKVENFCFTADSSEIAAVDFQYVGGGCGMKDVAYFLGSCLDEAQCERDGDLFLNHYFAHFRAAIMTRNSSALVDAVESEWRLLYPFAWADFTRFMQGWCPSQTRLSPYSQRIVEQVTKQLA